MNDPNPQEIIVRAFPLHRCARNAWRDYDVVVYVIGRPVPAMDFSGPEEPSTESYALLSSLGNAPKQIDKALFERIIFEQALIAQEPARFTAH